MITKNTKAVTRRTALWPWRSLWFVLKPLYTVGETALAIVRRGSRGRIIRRIDVFEFNRSLSVEHDGRFAIGVGEMIRMCRHQGKPTHAKAHADRPVQLAAHSHEELARHDRHVLVGRVGMGRN